MAYRNLTSREVSVLAGLSRELLPAYVRQLAQSGVRYRDIGSALDLSESSVADLASIGRPPVAGQVVPEWLAARLRRLHAEQSARLNATLAAARDRGWTFAALAEALGISAPAVRSRSIRPGKAQPAVTVIPAPGEGACGSKRGTDTGYERHRRGSEPACDECLLAHSEVRRSANREYMSARRARQRQGDDRG
jgi:hypothetical protein